MRIGHRRSVQGRQRCVPVIHERRCVSAQHWSLWVHHTDHDRDNDRDNNWDHHGHDVHAYGYTDCEPFGCAISVANVDANSDTNSNTQCRALGHANDGAHCSTIVGANGFAICRSNGIPYGRSKCSANRSTISITYDDPNERTFRSAKRRSDCIAVC